MFTDQMQFSEEMLNGSRLNQSQKRSRPAKRNPGFVALATALRTALSGGFDRDKISGYKTALSQSLETAQERIQRLAVPTQVAACVSPIVRNAEITLDKLNTVLELVDDYLHAGSSKALEEAISLLDLVQLQMKVAY